MCLQYRKLSTPSLNQFITCDCDPDLRQAFSLSLQLLKGSNPGLRVYVPRYFFMMSSARPFPPITTGCLSVFTSLAQHGYLQRCLSHISSISARAFPGSLAGMHWRSFTSSSIFSPICLHCALTGYTALLTSLKSLVVRS